VSWIKGEDQLRAFRQEEFTVEALVDALASTGGLLLPQEPGVGKSHLLDGLVRHHRDNETWELMLLLTSQHRAIQERACVQEFNSLSEGEKGAHDVVVLSGRPATRCGALKDEWFRLERAGCSLVAKNTLCRACPLRSECSWPGQLTRERLRGKRLICGTQANLQVIPQFVDLVRRKTGVEKILVALDEGTILDTCLNAVVGWRELERSLDVLRRVQRTEQSGDLASWIRVHERLLNRRGNLYRCGCPPPLGDQNAMKIMSTGLAMFGDDFRFLGFRLRHMARSRRWRTSEGVAYICRPVLEDTDFLVASAGAPPDLVRHRLDDPDLRVFCSVVRFLHEDTRIFNIRSSLGAACHFQKNAPQILFAVAQLVLDLAREGKRSLIISKKRFAGEVCLKLEQYLAELSGKAYRVVHDPGQEDLGDELVVPLLHYGVQGLNTFQDFHAAIAVNSYNARTDVLRDRLNDLYPPGKQVPFELMSVAGRRVARVVGHQHRKKGFDRLAAAYQDHLETGWAEQALGRVRFATRPRLVVFFQNGPLRYPLTEEFRSLAGLREHFGLLSRREWERRGVSAEVRALRQQGMTHAQIAEEVGRSVRTVRRILKAHEQGDRT